MHVRLAQAHRLYRADRHRGGGLRVLPLRARGHRHHRRHLQHRRLASRGVRERPRPGRSGRDLSRLARRRFHHPRRRAAGGGARTAVRGHHRPRRRGCEQGQGHHVDPRRHGGAAPYQGAADRDRLALSQAAQRRADPAPDRQRPPGHTRRRHGTAAQGDAEPAARRHPQLCRRRDRGRARLRRDLSAVPAMAGGADRRGAGAGQRQAGDRLHPRLLLCRVPIHGRHRSDQGPRPAARFAFGWPMIARFFGAVLLVAAASAVRAEPVEEFYRSKTIELLIGGAAGGGYDLAGRTVANHLGRHIPGNPSFVVRNLPGATSLIMTNQLYNVAKRDGTVIGMPLSNIPLEPRLKLISPDRSNVKFDVARLRWIGTPVQEPQITWVWHTAQARNLDDLRANLIRMGATTSSADNYILPTLVNRLLGTRMQVVTGYIGQNEINLAVERGEVQGNNTGLSNITVNKADWLRDGKVRILLQFGAERLPALPDVPAVAELAGAEEDRALLRFYAVKFNMARP